MLALIHILIRLIFQPGKYRVTHSYMTDNQIAVFCGTKEQIKKLEYILSQRLLKQVENDIKEYDKHQSL